MGWKGAIRSMAAASRRAERAAVRRQKELHRQHVQYEKMLQRERDAWEVEEYENHLEVLRSVHRDCAPDIRWQHLRDLPEPSRAAPARSHESHALQALANYRPGLLDRLFRRVEQRRAALAHGVELARAHDARQEAADAAAHAQAVQDWRDTRELAQRILAGDRTAYLEAMREMEPFGEMAALGSQVTVDVPASGPLHPRIMVNGEHVIPEQVKTLLQSGKLSVKKMPRGQFYDIYQDYICGCVLRVSRELFALLPVETLIVTAVGEVLNTASGHIEIQPILSVAIPRRTLSRLNFDAIDPSDSLRNFVHRMDFKKTKGFLPVRSIEPTEIAVG